MFTDNVIVDRFRQRWASAGGLGRAGLGLVAVLYFLSGVFLFQLAHGIWNNRRGASRALLSGVVALVGVFWVTTFAVALTDSGSPSDVATADMNTGFISPAGSDTTTTSTLAPTTTSTITPTTEAPEPEFPVAIEAAPGDLLIDLLAGIPIALEVQDGYDRELFEHWIDADGDGCDTRDEVLIRDAGGRAQVDAFGCAVAAADWYSAYDGTWLSDPADIDIDHVVALKEAWDSGAHSWSPEMRAAFANDLDEPGALIAVSRAANQSKGQADPSNWMPDNDSDSCRYLTAWVRVKAKWGLSMDPSEHGRIENLLEGECAGHKTIAVMVIAPPLPVTTTTAPTTTSTTQPTTTTTAAPATTTTMEAPANDCDTSYPTICIPPGVSDLDCGDISERMFKVLPPDPHGFDGNDNDGWGCES